MRVLRVYGDGDDRVLYVDAADPSSVVTPDFVVARLSLSSGKRARTTWPASGPTSREKLGSSLLSLLLRLPLTL
jgi:hypothetical protein